MTSVAWSLTLQGEMNLFLGHKALEELFKYRDKDAIRLTPLIERQHADTAESSELLLYFKLGSDLDFQAILVTHSFSDSFSRLALP